MVVRDAGLILSLAPISTEAPPEEPTSTMTPTEEPTPTVTPGPENGTAGDGENTRDAPAATPDGDLPSVG
jgi:hypothetical protein